MSNTDKISEIQKKYKEIFGGKFPLDAGLTVAFGARPKKVKIDIFAFENFLIEKGMSEEESMKDFILNKYGEEAVEFIERLL